MTTLALPPGWLRGVALLVGAGALLYLAMIGWSGATDSYTSIKRLGLATIGAGTLIASTSYLVRFARWQLILGWLGHHLPAGVSFRVYLSGLAVTTSPGKLGETIRSLFLLPRGVPLPASLAAFFTDRLSDVAGVALLAVAGSMIMGERSLIFEGVFAAVLLVGGLLALFLRKGSIGVVLAACRGMPRATAWAEQLLAPAQCWAKVWTFSRSLLFAASAFLAYGIQALVLAMYVRTLSTAVDIGHCVYIFASSTLIGAASMIPAGLGAMEAAVVYQLTSTGISLPDAIAVAIAHRLSTLWFATGLGVAAMLSLTPLQNDAPSGN